ncbi:3-octaprenyl-4-hydroxybenzoate carboxy-lyase [Striga asiatica]|uniref:3-octaprenyl-4-hydroxybenzoate carboxy-lyase n=1 Tax=Striga asiatica TaxID=4170 RepID=A0A5A7QHH8_STRAF|nr:3-octaprenyl-4-hydroxybenzoate carboxy-lyase [Striga asiatica]
MADDDQMQRPGVCHHRRADPHEDVYLRWDGAHDRKDLASSAATIRARTEGFGVRVLATLWGTDESIAEGQKSLRVSSFGRTGAGMMVGTSPSKVHRAKECLETLYQPKEPGMS